MKKFIAYICLLFITTLISPKETIKDWRCYKSIEINGENKYKYFFLDKEIYLYANKGLSDIRIVDDLENIVPYYIEEGFKIEKEEEVLYNLKLIKNSIEMNKEKTIKNSMFDYQILPIKKNLSCNKLELDIVNKEEYSNQIEVYGRNEKTNWSFITKDTIYNIDKFKKNQISFDGFLNYNFYRLKILDNRENIEINECKAIFKKIDNKYDKYKNKADLKFEVVNEDYYTGIKIKNPSNLKLINIDISAGGNFNREFDFFRGEDNLHFTSGSIYNFKHNNVNISNTKIDFEERGLNDTLLNLKIYNYDNTPLKIDKIEAEYIIDKIIFEDNESKTYKVYFGNPQAAKPTYDIESFQPYIEKEKQDQCSLGKLVKLKMKDAKKETSFNYKAVFNILIIIVSLVLILAITLILKRK